MTHPSARLSRSRRVVGVLVLAVAAALMSPVTTARAADSFYVAPSAVEGPPGTVLRSESMTFHLDPLRAIRSTAAATRVMYATRDRTGAPVAVTGTVLVPPVPWFGPGQRPVIGYAAGTQGMGDQCAPSRQLAAGSEYEGAFISGLLARGYAVAMTDYQGLGMPGTHTYMVREAQAHAVLDMVRAAQRLPGAGIPSAGPVMLAGYSQGGGATAAAVELAPAYAPELEVRGAVAGAVPADLGAVAAHLDGGLYSAFALYAVAGQSAAYGVDLGSFLKARGTAVIDAVKGECVGDSIALHAFTRASDLTKDGRDLTQLAATEPFRTIIADQRIGRLKPAAPVLVTHSVLDDVIPYAVGRGLASEWCARGATVAFSPNITPTHVGGAVPSFAKQFAFLEARVAGVPPVSDCWWL